LFRSAIVRDHPRSIRIAQSSANFVVDSSVKLLVELPDRFFAVNVQFGFRVDSCAGVDFILPAKRLRNALQTSNSAL
jgi:hypothetical protein